MGDPVTADLGQKILMESLNQKGPGKTEVLTGEQLGITGDGANDIFKRVTKPDGTTDIIPLSQSDDLLSPEQIAQKKEIALAGRSVNKTNVNVAGDKFEEENAKKVGGFLGDSFVKTQETGSEARQQNAQLNAIEQLLEGVETGRGIPTLTRMAGLAERFGLELDEDLGQKEAAEAIAAQIALRFRNPESGLGLPALHQNVNWTF